MALQRFYNATEKLVNAFIMGEIKHGESCSCAVGNICNGSNAWALGYNFTNPHLYIRFSFGYDFYEVFEIEKTFEGRKYTLLQNGNCTPALNKRNDPDGFKGLCNVFDYLVSIEDWREEEKGANIFELLEQLN